MNRLSHVSRFSLLLRTAHQQQQALSFHVSLNFRIGSIFDVPSEETRSDDIFKSLTKTIDEGVIPSQQPQGRRFQRAAKQQQQQQPSAGSKIMRHIFEELQNTEAQQQQPTSSSSGSGLDSQAFDSFLFGDSKADLTSLQSLMQPQGTGANSREEEYYCGEKIVHTDAVTGEQFIKGKVKLISEALAKISPERIEALSSQTLKMVKLLRDSKESDVSEIEKVFLSIEKPTTTDFNLMAKAYSKDVSQRVGLKHSLDKQLQNPQSFGTVLLQTFAKLGQVENMQQLLDDGTVNKDAIAYMFLLKNLKEARASYEVLKQFYESIPQDLKEEGSFIYERLKGEEKIHNMEQVLLKEGPPLESIYFNPFVTPVYGFNRPYPKK
ncbi:hypothetical protein FDP41_010523 [Naegleria fowleri]|uniref:Uncharacterized protein n=1 Tax=Naegleria fowleri TaxID=5763 RepID=A0A6A5CD47_NAEFO|nr:uncharacterized protein FDP41_010523 [Naegleria fowleri]KAF0983458.1 hypothetical protein FDP41_010523 [Naegleria fowleri]CAG4715258.1 unnamed protein product [Naegleria fowleri]